MTKQLNVSRARLHASGNTISPMYDTTCSHAHRHTEREIGTRSRRQRHPTYNV